MQLPVVILTVYVPILIKPAFVIDGFWTDDVNEFGPTQLYDVAPGAFDINDKLNSLETITLKKPNEVYYKIYKEARQKAKQIKREAINAILEAKNIKNTYMIDSDSESDVDSEFDEDSETIDLDLDI